MKDKLKEKDSDLRQSGRCFTADNDVLELDIHKENDCVLFS